MALIFQKNIISVKCANAVLFYDVILILQIQFG